MSLPLGKGVLVVWFVAAFFLFTTTMDSASYTMAAACTKKIAVGDDPRIPFRILFAVFLSITPLCLIVSGSSLAGFKSVLIITAVPISILIIMCLISCQKWLFQDYGDWTSQEIQKYFSVYEDDIPIFDNHGNLINNVVLDDETGERLDVAETETAETTENA